MQRKNHFILRVYIRLEGVGKDRARIFMKRVGHVARDNLCEKLK